MTTVRIVGGARYGFKMVGLVFGLLVISGALFALGGLLATGGDLTLRGSLLAVGQPAMVAAGGFFGLAGVATLYAGTVGLVHKLIADSVTAGFENADPVVTSPAPTGADAAGDSSEPAGEDTSEPAAATSGRAEQSRDDSVTADSPATEPTADTVDSTTDSTEPVTERVEPESVDLVDEPTPKPGQNRPSTESTVDTAGDDDLDSTGSAAQKDGGETEPVVEASGAGAEGTDPTEEPATEVDEVATEDGERPTPEDIDRVVSQATGSGLSDEPTGETTQTDADEPLGQPDAPPADDETGTAADSGEDTFAESESESGRAAAEDIFTGSEREAPAADEQSESHKADVIDRAFQQEDEENLDDPHTVIDDAIQDGDVEDTTDEPGDWEPLDESDLKD